MTPGTYLALATPTLLTIKAEALQAGLSGRGPSEDQFWCLTSSVAASNLGANGIEFGFIGNEAARRK